MQARTGQPPRHHRDVHVDSTGWSHFGEQALASRADICSQSTDCRGRSAICKLAPCLPCDLQPTMLTGRSSTLARPLAGVSRLHRRRRRGKRRRWNWYPCRRRRRRPGLQKQHCGAASAPPLCPAASSAETRRPACLMQNEFCQLSWATNKGAPPVGAAVSCSSSCTSLPPSTPPIPPTDAPPSTLPGIQVTPGDAYTVEVGRGGDIGTVGGISYFFTFLFEVLAGGGNYGTTVEPGEGGFGQPAGGRGGRGGAIAGGRASGGGGAGGYDGALTCCGCLPELEWRLLCSAAHCCASSAQLRPCIRTAC